MRLLYLDWPHLPLRLEAARGSFAGDLVVLGGQPWEPGTVLDCSAAARSLGVRRGQPLGSAHNLVPEAAFVSAQPRLYREAFEAALDALSAFTPALEGEPDPVHERFGQVFLGIEGLDRLWGDEQTLVRRVAASVAPLLPGPVRAGIGNTRFGAQVAAVVGARRSPVSAEAAAALDETGRGTTPACETIPPGDAATEATYLGGLAIRLLPGDRAIHDRFRLFGLTRIGEFASLPRSAVVARFGSAGAELHDLARGFDGRPLRPRRPIERLRAEAELEPPVEQLEALRFVLHSLTGALCAQLDARGSGAARASLELELERSAPLRLEQALPEPVAVPEMVERLLLARLEASPPSAPVTRLALELHGTAPARGQQLGLFTPQLARAARLDWQLSGLAIRFGPDRIRHAAVRDPEARLAEDRFEWRPASEPAAAVPAPDGRARTAPSRAAHAT